MSAIGIARGSGIERVIAFIRITKIVLIIRPRTTMKAFHAFLRRHYREIVARIAYWTSEPPSLVRSLLDQLIVRVQQLALRAGRLEAATLIELTAYAMAVIMNYRATRMHPAARPRLKLMTHDARRDTESG